MQLIETIEVGSGGASSIEFTGIPQDADDLFLVLNGLSGLTNQSAIYFNADTNTANYSSKNLGGTGSSAFSQSPSSPYLVSSPTSYGSYGNSQVYIPNYTSSVAKSLSIDGLAPITGAGQSRAELQAGAWSGTSAITSIRLQPAFGETFNQYSTASLYKITKA